MTFQEEAEWSDVVNVSDLIAERDAARAEARKARTAQAAAVADLEEARQHLITGVLYEARRQAKGIGSPEAMQVVTQTANRYGVTL